MKNTQSKGVRGARRRGAALVTSFILLSLVAVAGVSYLSHSTEVVRNSSRMLADAQTTQLCEAGVQEVLRSIWRPFKQSQTFTAMDTDLSGASAEHIRGALTGSITGVGAFSGGVIGVETDPNNTYVRTLTIRAVGWVDRDSDGVLDENEPSKTVDVKSRFELARSQIFDYTYFINNYGWMDGFRETDLYVNGDMRANGNFDFLNGSPTVNGSVLAAVNDKIVPRATGLLNAAPVKMAQATYAGWTPPAPPRLGGESDSAYTARVAAYRAMILQRRRASYSSVTHGADGTDDYEATRDFVFRSTAALVKDRTAGAIIGDAEGTRGWTRTSVGQTPTVNMLDTEGTREIIMPDLNNLSVYTNLSQTWRDNQGNYGDGTPNPHAGNGAWIEVYNTTTRAYQRLSTNGVVTGSGVLVGTSDYPIKIHGPVTFTQDVAIKGVVEGQGTIYSGRNIYAVGSIRYKNGPDFSGSDPSGNDNQNSKKDMLGLAARGSVLMGNPNSYGNPYPLGYMTPANPPTKNYGTYGRYDENGVWIPPFNAYEVDSTGLMRYQSTIPAATLSSIAEGVNQIDGVLYSNFVGGGQVGTSGGGFLLNGTIISRDEAIVTYSLPLIMNYDNRVRERRLNNTPLIDLNLPRSPVMLRSTWQDRGFHMESD